MEYGTLILSILTALLGGTNILQLFNNKELRRKLAAESSQEETKSLRLIIEGNIAEISRLQSRLDEYAVRYDNLLDKYVAIQHEMIELKKLINK